MYRNFKNSVFVVCDNGKLLLQKEDVGWDGDG